MGKREQHASTLYEDKEGYQWESTSRAMSPRLKEQMSKVISVCDREARTATRDITFAPVTLKVPYNKKGQSLPVYYVGCAERGNPSSDLNWHLLEQ